MILERLILTIFKYTMKIKSQNPRSPVPNAFGIGMRMSEDIISLFTLFNLE